MAILFHVIGTQLNAYRAPGGGTAVLVTDTASNSDAAVITDNTSGVFSSRLIQLTHTASFRGIQWKGGANLPSSPGPISVKVRIVPRITGTPGANIVLWAAEGLGLFNTNTCLFHIDTANKLEFLIKDTVKGTTFVAATSSAVLSPGLVSGTPIEFMATWDGTTNAGSVKFYINGVQLGTSQNATNAAVAWNRGAINYIMCGGSARFAVGNYDLNELIIYDSVMPAYTVGAAFETDTAFDADTNAGAGAANIRSGSTEVIAGSTITGTLDLPAQSDVKTGVTYDGASKTGTYTGSDRWSDPGIANVRTATAYKANSTSNNRTGTAAIPGAADVRSGTATDAGTGTLVVPSLANTKIGVAGDGGTGAYDGSDRWSDPAVANVRNGTAYKANSTSNNRTGQCIIPATTDVKHGILFDNGGSSTGTYRGADLWEVPAQEDVRNGTAYLEDGTPRTGGLDLPAPGDVREGILFDNDSQEGTIIVPETYDVRDGVDFDGGTGELDLPEVTDVKDGIEFDHGNPGGVKVGTLNVGFFDTLAPENVRYGVDYIADDVSYSGTMIGKANDLRGVINEIFRAIGTSAITDEEFDALPDGVEATGQSLYDALYEILVARGASADMLARLEHYFLARGYSVNVPEDETATKIVIGANLDEAVTPTQEEEAKSNIFLGGEL